MATIKSYTDISQSKALKKILPLESADMSWVSCDNGQQKYYQAENRRIILNYEKKHWIPCWSLASLLDIVKTYSSRLEITLRADKNYNIFAVSGDFVFRSFDECSEGYNNLVDACYNLVIKLNELKML